MYEYQPSKHADVPTLGGAHDLLFRFAGARSSSVRYDLGLVLGVGVCGKTLDCARSWSMGTRQRSTFPGKISKIL